MSEEKTPEDQPSKEAARVPESAETTTPSAQVQAAQDGVDAKRMSLVKLVVAGTVGVTAVGALIFLWFAFLLSDVEWSVTFDWIASVEGDDWFNAARTTATLLAIIGIGGAALVAYRRQDTTELTHRLAQKQHAVAIEAQQTGVAAQKVAAAQASTAAEQLKLDSRKYELDRERHDLEKSRRADDQGRILRERFSTVAEQLGSDRPMLRVASVHAFAALADDWHRFGKDEERQVCIDLLCGQLQNPDTDEDVRKAIIGVLKSHRAPVSAQTDFDRDWNECAVDLNGSNLRGANLSRAKLTNVTFDSCDMTAVNLSWANCRGASFARATLTDADLIHADMSVANLTAAVLDNVPMVRTQLVGASATYASFVGSVLRGANFSSASLGGADFTNADIDDECRWEGIFWDSATKWPDNFDPPASRLEGEW